jgi:hypothetical protein
MNHFITTQAKILRASHLHPTYDAGVVDRDLDRTQIPGSYHSPRDSQDSGHSASPRSGGETDSEASDSDNSTTSERKNYEEFFKGFFERHEADLPYNQGMLTGSHVYGILLKEFYLIDPERERIMDLQTNTCAVSFCFKADDGTWQGVSLRMNLKTYEWYATVTDFSSSPAQVAIVGEGSYYDLLKNKLNVQDHQAQPPLNDFIKNESLKCAFGQFSMFAKIAKLQNTSAQTTFSKFLGRFLATCGCTEYFMELFTKDAPKLQQLDESYESPTTSRSESPNPSV